MITLSPQSAAAVESLVTSLRELAERHEREIQSLEARLRYQMAENASLWQDLRDREDMIAELQSLAYRQVGT